LFPCSRASLLVRAHIHLTQNALPYIQATVVQRLGKLILFVAHRSLELLQPASVDNTAALCIGTHRIWRKYRTARDLKASLPTPWASRWTESCLSRISCKGDTRPSTPATSPCRDCDR
jgi:hypothetical protein